LDSSEHEHEVVEGERVGDGGGDDGHVDHQAAGGSHWQDPTQVAVLVAPDQGSEHGGFAERGQYRCEERQNKRAGNQPDQQHRHYGEQQKGERQALAERVLVVELESGVAPNEHVVRELKGAHLAPDGCG
jgi:hypothetical protein